MGSVPEDWKKANLTPVFKGVGEIGEIIAWSV